LSRKNGKEKKTEKKSTSSEWKGEGGNDLHHIFSWSSERGGDADILDLSARKTKERGKKKIIEGKRGGITDGLTCPPRPVKTEEKEAGGGKVQRPALSLLTVS